MPDVTWLKSVEAEAESFAARYGSIYRKSERELAASFEIGCFLAVVHFYEKNCGLSLENLTEERQYRYLTTPSGNPANFSYVRIEHQDHAFQLRQQVRITSHIGDNIAFTPDFVVIHDEAKINGVRDLDFAGGKRAFFSVQSKEVIAAHECKSMNPFPELLVSFIGTLVAGHSWMDEHRGKALLRQNGMHLAPTLFVGGTARRFHIRMVNGLEGSYPMNIILGMHRGNWRLKNRSGLKRLRTPRRSSAASARETVSGDDIPF